LELASVVASWNGTVAAGDDVVKPSAPFEKTRIPRTDYCFYSGIDRWGGYSSPNDGQRHWNFRNPFNLSREYRLTSARERATEMAVFSIIIFASAWPVIYMIVSVVKLLITGRPLD
jgi:hypothetical protein